MQSDNIDIVRFVDVSLKFEEGPTVFDRLNFGLKAGTFHFLTGPSGVGKSSLLRLMYAGCAPSSGQISVFNRDLHTLKAEEYYLLRRKMGVVFQDFRLLDHLSAIDNVMLPLKVRGHSATQIYRQAEELLHWVGMDDALHAYPPTLSGGQKQRVAIARAVIGRPRLLLADEPTGNVDEDLALKLLYLFEELHKNGTTVLVATHNRSLAQEFPYPELHMDHGHISVIPHGRGDAS